MSTPRVPSTPRPSLVILDVNETLSDMSPLRSAFERIGLDPQHAATWFASLLRDGFALTAVGDNPAFATLARESLTVLVSAQLGRTPGHGTPEEAVDRVISALAELPVHEDVPTGLRLLHEQGLRVVTLSNGASATASALLERAGVATYVARMLSVEDAAAWKPDRRAYEHALAACDVADPEDAMLVAVHPWDVDGAHRAGLRTAWINRSGAAYPSYFARADVEVGSLTELAPRWS